jgi:hypothetical protein
LVNLLHLSGESGTPLIVAGSCMLDQLHQSISFLSELVRVLGLGIRLTRRCCLILGLYSTKQAILVLLVSSIDRLYQYIVFDNLSVLIFSLLFRIIIAMLLNHVSGSHKPIGIERSC